MSRYNPGDIVLVTIEENGYWKDLRSGFYVKTSTNGRIGVRFSKDGKTRYYSPYNVRPKPPKEAK